MTPLPYATEGRAGIGGRIKKDPTDFLVSEIPLYMPSGNGDHLYVHFEKRGMSTLDAVRVLGDQLGKGVEHFGIAGMKDSHAVTRQWVSIEHADENRLADAPDLRILSCKRHNNKLRTGHLAGNAFVIRIRDMSDHAMEEAVPILDALQRRGVPNYYGLQRFGRNGENVERGLQLLARAATGARMRLSKSRRFELSAVQSLVFNQVLATRIETYDTILPGDWARKTDTGGLFLSEGGEEDQSRASTFAISPTGWLPGWKVPSAEKEAGRLEAAALESLELDADRFRLKSLRMPGSRRPLRYAIQETTLSAGVDTSGTFLELGFKAPAGCYATSVVRELTKAE